jgi:hypothetical protein
MMPSIMEILGYVYFPGGTMCGPFFEFSDYKNFIEKNGHYKNIPSTIAPSLIRTG